MAISPSEASDGPQCCDRAMCGFRELQAQEALETGQLGAGDGAPDLQPGVLASQALMEKILGEDPRWQGNPAATAVCRAPARWTSSPRLCAHWPPSAPPLVGLVPGLLGDGSVWRPLPLRGVQSWSRPAPRQPHR